MQPHEMSENDDEGQLESLCFSCIGLSFAQYDPVNDYEFQHGENPEEGVTKARFTS